MSQHQWVKHTVEPIAIVDIEGDDGTDESGPEMFLDPDREVETLYGCATCGSVLTEESAKTNCAGEDGPVLVLPTTREAVEIDNLADSDD